MWWGTQSAATRCAGPAVLPASCCAVSPRIWCTAVLAAVPGVHATPPPAALAVLLHRGLHVAKSALCAACLPACLPACLTD